MKFTSIRCVTVTGSRCHSSQAEEWRYGRGIQEPPGEAAAATPGLLLDVELPQRSCPRRGEGNSSRTSINMRSRRGRLLSYIGGSNPLQSTVLSMEYHFYEQLRSRWLDGYVAHPVHTVVKSCASCAPLGGSARRDWQGEDTTSSLTVGRSIDARTWR